VRLTFVGASRRASMMTLGLLTMCLAIVLAAPAGAATATQSLVCQSNCYFGLGPGPADGALTGAQGVAVEPGTGNVAVADQGNGRVEVFDLRTDPGNGTFLATINTGGAPHGVAFDPVTGTLYVSNGAGGTVTRYVSDGAAVPTFTLDGTFASPTQGSGAAQIGDPDSAIAVDPVTHDLLVADTGNHRVSRYSSGGTFVSSFDGSTSAGGAFTGPDDIAVAPSGNIYVVDGNSRVEEFDPAGASLGALAGLLAPNSVAVNPTTSAVTVLDGAGVGSVGTLYNFDASGGPTSIPPQPYEGFSQDSLGRGIAVAPNGTTYGAITPSGVGGYDLVLNYRLLTTPGVDDPVVSQIEATRVHVSSAVDSGPGPPPGSVAHFEYSTDGVSWTALPDQNSTTSPVEADITGLDADTDYVVRTVASNAGDGSAATSNAAFFHTGLGAPRVATGDAGYTDDQSVLLTGTVNPFGQATTYHFEYGTTADYGSRVPASAEASAGDGRADRTVSQSIEGLAANTTYHFRLVATSSQGSANGADRTFTTNATREQDSWGYEQVTPVEHAGGTIDPLLGFLASPDAQNVVFTADTALGDAALTRPDVGLPLYPRYVTHRSASGWSTPTPVGSPFTSNSTDVLTTVMATSDDGARAFVASNQALASGALADAANLYIEDVANGTYKLVATNADVGAFESFTGLDTHGKQVVAEAPDLSWIVFGSSVSLLPGVTGYGIYRWSDSTGLTLESVMPDGTPAGSGADATTGLDSVAVSTDGSRVFLTATPAGSSVQSVYLRAGGTTEPISVSHIPGASSAPVDALLLGASADGRYAFFSVTGATPLTSGAPATVGNLYRYDADSGGLVFVDRGASGTSKKAFAVSADGSTIYYIYSSTTEIRMWRNGSVEIVKTALNPDAPAAYTSPDGHLFAIAEYDNVNGLPDESRPRVSVFDANTHKTTCVSCAPAGVTTRYPARLTLSKPDLNGRRARSVTDQAVYFTSPSRLVRGDRNSTDDVYRFRNGNLSLVSPGDAPFNARLLDVSADSRHVYFSTSESLVGQDTNRAVDAYDASIGGGIASQNPVTNAPCVGSQCSEPSSGVVSSQSTGSQTTPIVKVLTRSNEKRATVSLSKVSVTKTALHVTVKVSGQARIRISGTRVRVTIRNAAKAGNYTMVVPLSSKARTLRRGGHKFRLSVRVSATPQFGKAAVAKISKTLGK
jgi:DNA-binding beta-propeller fold protein YncE